MITGGDSNDVNFSSDSGRLRIWGTKNMILDQTLRFWVYNVLKTLIHPGVVHFEDLEGKVVTHVIDTEPEMDYWFEKSKNENYVSIQWSKKSNQSDSILCSLTLSISESGENLSLLAFTFDIRQYEIKNIVGLFHDLPTEQLFYAAIDTPDYTNQWHRSERRDALFRFRLPESQVHQAESILLSPYSSQVGGRKIVLAAMYLWFGEEIFRYLSRKRFLSFPYAEYVEELSNGTICIHLCDGLFTGDIAEHKRRQYLLQEHMGIGEGM